MPRLISFLISTIVIFAIQFPVKMMMVFSELRGFLMSSSFFLSPLLCFFLSLSLSFSLFRFKIYILFFFYKLMFLAEKTKMRELWRGCFSIRALFWFHFKVKLQSTHLQISEYNSMSKRMCFKHAHEQFCILMSRMSVTFDVSSISGDCRWAYVEAE